MNHAAEHLCCIEILNPFQESSLLWRVNNLFQEGNCEEEVPKKPVGRLSAICWPTVGRLLADCRPSVGRLSAVCWPTVGHLLADCRPSVGRLSADCRRLLAVCRPFVRLSVGRQSADKRPTVGRQLVMCGKMSVICRYNVITNLAVCALCNIQTV